MSISREEALAKARAEIADFKRTHPPEDWGLNSQYVREQQVANTEERIIIVQNLRKQSLGYW